MDPNLPIDAAGRVYHLQVTAAELAPRILSVGDAGRAERIAALFDAHAPVTRVASSRGFVTHTGCFGGVRVSVVCTGMGSSMMDFVVREARVMVDGPMAILRFGTCGGLGASPAGAIAVASHGAVHIRRDPDMARAPVAAAAAAADSGDAASPRKQPPPVGGPLIAATPALPYVVSHVVRPHAGLAAAYAAALAVHVTGALGAAHPVVEGVNATAQGFYDTQGRSLAAVRGGGGPRRPTCGGAARMGLPAAGGSCRRQRCGGTRRQRGAASGLRSPPLAPLPRTARARAHPPGCTQCSSPATATRSCWRRSRRRCPRW